MTTLSKYLQEYQNYLVKKKLSPATVAGYTADLQSFFKWIEIDQRRNEIENLSGLDLHLFIETMLKSNQCRISTINRRIAGLSSFFSWLFSSGFLDQDLSKTIHCIPSDTPGINFLNLEQQAVLIKAVEKDLRLSKIRFPKRWLARQRDASMIKFLLHTGLRLNEVIHISMNDLHMFDRKGAIEVRNGTQGRERTVPLNTEARKAVLEWLAVRPEVETEYVWIAVENEIPASALSGRSVQRVIRRVGQDAGIDDLTPQVLRHTFAKNLVESGVSLEKVAALLGQRSLDSTRVYITPSQQDLEKAVAKLESERIS
jgi:integrase/recombinase XerD